MRKIKVQTRTLEKVLSWLDKNLHLPLSVDDALYARWKIHDEIFRRQYEQMEKQLFEKWSKQYLIRFHDGYYENGQLINKRDLHRS
jgi:hypothetical protein